MRKISAWAKHHRMMARLSIIFIKLLLAIMAWYTGRMFSKMEIAIPEATSFVALSIMITAALLYPARHARASGKLFYLHQKSCDFTLAICTFIIMAAITNNQLYPVITSPAHASTRLTITSQPPTAEEILASLKYRDKKTLTKQERKILRQEFKKQLKIFSTATIQGNRKEADEAVLTILVIIGAIGLTILLAALVCSISCSGAEGAAVAVALLGLIAIIWLSAALIRRINRGPRIKNRNVVKAN